MSTKERENFPKLDIKLYPYWRRIMVGKDKKWILALCGAESLDEPPLPDCDIGLRYLDCPWYHSGAVIAAYECPSVFAVNPETLRMRTILDTEGVGAYGIADLENRWEEACRLFEERFGNRTLRS